MMIMPKNVRTISSHLNRWHYYFFYKLLCQNRLDQLSISQRRIFLFYLPVSLYEKSKEKRRKRRTEKKNADEDKDEDGDINKNKNKKNEENDEEADED